MKSFLKSKQSIAQIDLLVPFQKYPKRNSLVRPREIKIDMLSRFQRRKQQLLDKLMSFKKKKKNITLWFFVWVEEYLRARRSELLLACKKLQQPLKTGLVVLDERQLNQQDPVSRRRRLWECRRDTAFHIHGRRSGGLLEKKKKKNTKKPI